MCLPVAEVEPVNIDIVRVLVLVPVLLVIDGHAVPVMAIAMTLQVVER